MMFRLTPDASGLMLTILSMDYSTGQTQEIPIRFSPMGTGATETAPVDNQQPDASQQPAGVTASQLDPRLIGRWSASDSMISGNASFVSSSSVTFAADGTYLYQDGPAYASGSFTSGSTSISSPQASGGDAGRWRVEGDLLYTMPNATGQWQLLGRVYIEGGRALVYYPDGSKTVWQRSQ